MRKKYVGLLKAVFETLAAIISYFLRAVDLKFSGITCRIMEKVTAK